MSDGIPNVYREDGRWVFRASSFGNCDANLVRSALGVTAELPPEAIQDAMNQSAGYEQPILKAVQERGVDGNKFKYLDRFDLPGWTWKDGQPEVELEGPGWLIRCHPDAVAQFYLTVDNDLPLGERRVVEIKALKRASASMLEKDSYQWQFSIEMAATRMPGLVVVGWKTDDGVLTPEMTVARLDRPPFSYGQIRRRANLLVEKIAAKDLDCTVRQYPCGYWQEHDKTQGVWAEEITEIEDPLLAASLELYSEYAKTEKVAKKQREQTRDDIIKMMKNRMPNVTPGKYRAGKGVFNYVAEKRRGSIKWDDLKPETIEDIEANRDPAAMSEYIQGVKFDG